MKFLQKRNEKTYLILNKYKKKVYFLTNIFTNTHYAFVPNILDENINKLLTEFTDLSSVNKKKVIESIKSKEENIDLSNISLLKDTTKIISINIFVFLGNFSLMNRINS